MTHEKLPGKKISIRIAAAAFALLAVLFFFSVILPELRREERTLVVPIHITGVPENHLVTYQSQSKAEVRIKANSETLSHPDLLRLQVTMAPGELEKEGVYPIEMLSQHADKITIKQITPSEIHLRLTRTASRIVEVTPRITGSPAPGFRVAKVEILPATARITAPMKAIHALSNISTTAVSVEGATASVETTVAPQTSEIQPAILSPALFKVRVTIEAKPVVANLPAISITPSPGETRSVTFTPPKVHLQVSATASVLEHLKTHGGVTATIDTRELPLGIHVRRAAITLPEGASLASATPELFTVTIAQ